MFFVSHDSSLLNISALSHKNKSIISYNSSTYIPHNKTNNSTLISSNIQLIFKFPEMPTISTLQMFFKDLNYPKVYSLHLILICVQPILILNSSILFFNLFIFYDDECFQSLDQLFCRMLEKINVLEMEWSKPYSMMNLQ